jgi:hypothetical protein
MGRAENLTEYTGMVESAQIGASVPILFTTEGLTEMANNAIAVSQRLIGRIGTVPGADGYGFISLSTVERSDGSPHNLPTKSDVFVHQDDCCSKLRPGMMVEFNAIERPGHPGEYRATGAIEFVEAELIPSHEMVVPGFSAPLPFNPVTEMEIAKTILPIHSRMKSVSAQTVEKVVANKPMPDIPRSIGRPKEGQQEQMLQNFLLNLFPHMAGFGTDFKVLEASDEELDRQVSEEVESLRELGMTDHAAKIKLEVDRFKSTRSAIRFAHEEGLVRPDTIVPIRYLPDIFMAVPVWFYYAGQDVLPAIADTGRVDDPRVHPWTRYFCDLFPRDQRWADTFQLYNRRMRSLRDYAGEGFDVIPPFIARRLKWAVKAFDFVVIATPYHDLAARDWRDVEWLRSIDPYVLGFKKGIPYFFILARFSDSGTFPLYHRLVGDAIEFLKVNLQKLDGFNTVRNPYWYDSGNKSDIRFNGELPGEILKEHVRALLRAFDQGNLFDWLRQEDEASPVPDRV